MALLPFFGGVQRPGFLLVILTHILIIHTKSPKEIITNFSQLFYFATSKHTGVKIHFLLLKPRILFKIYLTFWPKNSSKIYWKVFNFCPSVCYSETEIRFCWLFFFNEELQKKILKLLSSRHVIFCLTMCNRKQDLVFFILSTKPTNQASALHHDCKGGYTTFHEASAFVREDNN